MRMKLIVVTAETFSDKESVAINRLFERGLERLHLRKPFASRNETERFILQIDPSHYAQIVLHDHYALTKTFPLGGIHLNRRNSKALIDKGLLTFSRSCHTFEEVKASHDCDYVFLSPLFDSISKMGYKQQFTPEQLADAQANGIINDRVIALGGITVENISQIRRYGFGGVAVLGSLWGDFVRDGSVSELLRRFETLSDEILPHVKADRDA